MIDLEIAKKRFSVSTHKRFDGWTNRNIVCKSQLKWKRKELWTKFKRNRENSKTMFFPCSRLKLAFICTYTWFNINSSLQTVTNSNPCWITNSHLLKTKWLKLDVNEGKILDIFAVCTFFLLELFNSTISVSIFNFIFQSIIRTRRWLAFRYIKYFHEKLLKNVCWCHSKVTWNNAKIMITIMK